VALLVAVVVVAASARRSDSALTQATQLVANPKNYDTGREAGDTLVSAATELLREARHCVARHGASPYCLAFRSAAAWSNVAAVKALECRAPGRYQLRRVATSFYRRLERLPTTVSKIPRPPPLPECG
jgi:hypothetical protein